MRIPSQLPANQQGSLFTDSPLPHTSPAPTSPNTQFFPGNCGVFPMTGRGLSFATVQVGNRCTDWVPQNFFVGNLLIVRSDPGATGSRHRLSWLLQW